VGNKIGCSAFSAPVPEPVTGKKNLTDTKGHRVDGKIIKPASISIYTEILKTTVSRVITGLVGHAGNANSPRYTLAQTDSRRMKRPGRNRKRQTKQWP